MRLRRMPSHPLLPLEGRSKHFQSFWELELDPGEETSKHQHYDSEEVIYLVSGDGRILVRDDEHELTAGEVVFVPPRTDHLIANRSEALLRAITVESRFGVAAEEAPADEIATPDEVQKTVRAQEEARQCSRTIEELVAALPTDVDEAVAIKTIVELFDIGGRLSETIENEIGLDNREGLAALERVERQIMLAVVQITGRYQRRGRGWLFG
ncbi:MAG: cupin domain-containing protein [Planctomycetota bacterium]|nr:MAG: cupin domain-containing protein [Planctomycetota bacterium]